MTIKIPVKPYTLKFLAFYLGAKYKLSDSDPYGIYLGMLLVKKASKGQREGSLGRYTVSFDVETCENKQRKNGYQGLTNLTIVYFNNFVEGILKHEFHSAAAIYQKTGQGTIQVAIDEFMTKFDLTADDIDPASLRRSYIRYRSTNLDRDKLQIRRYKNRNI